jgi:hypothetical protein
MVIKSTHSSLTYMPSQLGGISMGLRFERSVGVFQLVRWNLRESALMFRLGLLKLAENTGPTNVRNPIAALETAPSTETSPYLQRRQVLEPEMSPPSDKARLARTLLKIAFMAAIFLAGYLAGRLTTPEKAPTVEATVNQGLAAPSVPEPLAPLASSAPPATVLPEASMASAPPVSKVTAEASLPPTPVSEVTAPKSVSTLPGSARPSSDEVRETQAWLKALGFDPGPLDGLPGPQTTAAVRHYQNVRQKEETGLLDRSLLQDMRKQVGQ